MSLQASTLRPGFLVSLKTKISGNVSYKKATLDAEHLDEDGAQHARWETERTIVDPEEFERAKQVRNRCRTLIAGVCSATSFALLCPENKATKLENAITESRRLADTFNEGASTTEIEVLVITGRISPDDSEAIRSINSELRGLLAEMKTGIEKLDVEVIRDAANRARAIGSMLSPDAAKKLKDTISAVRGAARKITKAGEVASREVNALAIKAITDARTAFLDLDDHAVPTDVALPEAEGRMLDLAPSEDTENAAPHVTVPAFELESE